MNLKTATEIYRKKDKVFYRDGGKLIKLFDESYPKENILNEALNQARVEGTALHIPRIEAVTTAEGRWAIVMEYIEGETLAALMKKYPKREREYLDLLSELQKEVSGQRVPLLPRLKDKMREKISASEYSESVKYDLLARLDGLPRHYKLCHGDFRPSNVILTALYSGLGARDAGKRRGGRRAHLSHFPPLRRGRARRNVYVALLRKDGHGEKLCGEDSAHRGRDADGKEHGGGKSVFEKVGGSGGLAVKK